MADRHIATNLEYFRDMSHVRAIVLSEISHYFRARQELSAAAVSCLDAVYFLQFHHDVIFHQLLDLCIRVRLPPSFGNPLPAIIFFFSIINTGSWSSMDSRRKPGSVRPDDAFCWFITAGNAVIAISASGFLRCFGLFYKPIMAEFDVQYGDVSLMSGLFGGSMAFGALIPSVARSYGCRKIAMIAGLIFSLSLFTSSFSPRMIYIHILAGIIPGICGGALIYAMYQTCNLYFKKHRAKATNLAMLGVPLGSIMLAPLLNYLIEQYTWSGALMLMSGVALNSCAAAALYRPVILNNTEFAMRNRSNSGTSDTNSSAVSRKEKSNIQRWCSKMDCVLFLNPSFVLMLISAIAYYPGSVGALFLLVPFGIDRIHLTSGEASFLLTLYGIGDCIGKFVYGAIGDIKRVDRALLLGITALFSSISFVAITFCVSYEATVAVAFLQGFVTSAYHGLNSVVYAEIAGLDRLPGALGYHGFLNNFAVLPIIYLLGLSVDKSGDVGVAFYICAGLLGCTSICLLLVFVLKRRQSSIEKKKTSDAETEL